MYLQRRNWIKKNNKKLKKRRKKLRKRKNPAKRRVNNLMVFWSLSKFKKTTAKLVRIRIGERREEVNLRIIRVKNECYSTFNLVQVLLHLVNIKISLRIISMPTLLRPLLLQHRLLLLLAQLIDLIIHLIKALLHRLRHRIDVLVNFQLIRQ